MKNSRLSFTALILSTALLQACATEITTSGRKVMMVSALTATEAERYEEICPLSCTELASSPPFEESCKNNLRNQAALVNADIIVIESHNVDQNSLSITARAYKKKLRD